MLSTFTPQRRLDLPSKNILKKRYFHDGETKWKQVSKRIVDFISDGDKETYDMIYNRYFLPNSPTIVNSGRNNMGLSACFVVDMPDTILGIYKTKLDFALIAKKGGGCGTTLSKVRPENDIVNGSTHGHAGGPIRFYDTICHDMKVLTQGGFREMAMMGTMTVYHPDIIKFINAKTIEGVMHTTNISVVVDDSFMRKVINNENYWTEFNDQKYYEYNAREIFDMIVDGAWKNGEPGLLFQERINSGPYKYTNQEIFATNPCGEQPLPANGVCNLGSLDLSKFLDQDKEFNWELFEKSIRLSVRFLDDLIDRNTYPTDDITEWAKNNRPIGLGIMGYADYLLEKKMAYGSVESLNELSDILEFMEKIGYNESENIGKIKGFPVECRKLPTPRRNITVLSIAPTGSISLLAGCNSSIEPVFSETIHRKDKTGEYEFFNSHYQESYFRCAVTNGNCKEVTWKEHIDTQNTAQKYIDSGVSKTINMPNNSTKDDVRDAYLYAWNSEYIKGITIYRNGSRQLEVLSPITNKSTEKCPLCSSNLIDESGCKHCSKCEFSKCEIG